MIDRLSLTWFTDARERWPLAPPYAGAWQMLYIHAVEAMPRRQGTLIGMAIWFRDGISLRPLKRKWLPSFLQWYARNYISRIFITGNEDISASRMAVVISVMRASRYKTMRLHSPIRHQRQHWGNHLFFIWNTNDAQAALPAFSTLPAVTASTDAARTRLIDDRATMSMPQIGTARYRRRYRAGSFDTKSASVPAIRRPRKQNAYDYHRQRALISAVTIISCLALRLLSRSKWHGRITHATGAGDYRPASRRWKSIQDINERPPFWRDYL